MISKEEFVRRISRGAPLSGQESAEIESQFGDASEAAAILAVSMSGIGFCSVQKRLNAFFAVCRHLDQLIDDGQVTAEEGQLALLILRASNAAFLKAVTMFDTRSGRYDVRGRLDMPRSARMYLAGIRVSHV